MYLLPSGGAKQTRTNPDELVASKLILSLVSKDHGVSLNFPIRQQYFHYCYCVVLNTHAHPYNFGKLCRNLWNTVNDIVKIVMVHLV